MEISPALVDCALRLMFAGSLVLLDKWAIGEFGVSQPVVSCPLIGWLFGDLMTGVFLGCALQLVWVEALPLGADRPLDYQSAGVVGITSFLFAQRAQLLAGSCEELRSQTIFFSLLLAGLATIFGQYTDDRLKAYNAFWYRLGMRARTRAGVTLAHLGALSFAFSRGLLVVGLFLVAMWAALPYLNRLPGFTMQELLIVPLGFGAAGIFRLFVNRQRIPFTLGGAVLGGLLWVLVR